MGNAAGFGVLTGGAVRYRILGAAGVRAEQVARLSVLTAATFALGLVVLGGLGATATAPMVGAALNVPSGKILAGGLAALVLSAALIAWTATGERTLRFRGITLEPPGFDFVVAQIRLVAVDVIGAGLVLWALLPAAHVGFGAFIALYTVALLLGVIAPHAGRHWRLRSGDAVCAWRHGASQFRGGRATRIPRDLFRTAPAAFSSLARRIRDARRGEVAPTHPRSGDHPGANGADLPGRHHLRHRRDAGGIRRYPGLHPSAHPAAQLYLPLWVLESSQFLGSVLGVWLLFLARGLLQRLDAAWWLALCVATASLLLSLGKGLAFVEAGILGFLIVLLLLTRHRFRRPASLFQEPLTPGWWVSIAIVLVVAFWVLFLAFRQVPYSRELWWQFELDGKAPRALRATVGATLFASAIALRQMLRLAPGKLSVPTALDLSDAERIVRSQERSDAMLAMMGDKTFLFSPTRTAFLMYARRGRSWVALYDPVGPRGEWPNLIRQFIALAHGNGGRAAFYQVRPESLPLYLDAGLRLLKLGEEARIQLPQFGLEGSRRANLRYALKRGERDGLSAEIVPSGGIAAILPVLQAISGSWMHSRHGHEKGFSVAGFDPSCLKSQSVMLVRQHGTPIAFAAFMTTDLHTDATVGAMRHVPEASPYAMEYLFTKLALHLKVTGYTTFSLGMAPLSGLTPSPLARRWHRVAHLVWRYGGHAVQLPGPAHLQKQIRASLGAALPGGFRSRGIVPDFGRYRPAGRRDGRMKLRLWSWRAKGRHAGLVADDLQNRPKVEEHQAIRLDPKLGVSASRSRVAGQHPAAWPCALLLTLSLGWLSAVQAKTLNGGDYGTVHVTPPSGAMQGFVVLFSRGPTPGAGDRAAADALARKGAYVLGVDTEPYLQRIGAAKDCHHMQGDAEALSHQIERELGTTAYFAPIMAGIGTGGMLAESALEEAPANTIDGAVSIDPSASLDPRARPCEREAPGPGLPGFWEVAASPALSPAAKQTLADMQAKGLHLTLHHIPADQSELDTLVALITPHLGEPQYKPEDVSDLPLIELPAAHPTEMLAVVISGDGGWRDIDKSIAQELQNWGIDVVGWDSLRYFWGKKTPARTAHDLARILRTYGARWHTKHFALIGYSFGADVMPFAYNRLPGDLRRKVTLMSLLGFAPAADFEIRVFGWLGMPPSAEALPVKSEIARVPPAVVQCFYGADEDDTYCPKLQGTGVTLVRYPRAGTISAATMKHWPE